jgi:uncharacterized protein (DUF4415 family)
MPHNLPKPAFLQAEEAEREVEKHGLWRPRGRGPLGTPLMNYTSSGHEDLLCSTFVYTKQVMKNNKKMFTLSDGSMVEDLTDWERLDAMTDEEILEAAKDDPDVPPLTKEQLSRFRRLPEVPGGNFIDRIRALSKENKIPLNVRYDADIVHFFRAQGKGYQRLMNNVLRAYMESQTSARHDSNRS